MSTDNPEITTIWISNNFLLPQTVFIRQEAPSTWNGINLKAAWQAQLAVSQAEKNKTVPDFKNAPKIGLYHVRLGRFIEETQSIEAQGIKEGDVFVLMLGDINDVTLQSEIVNSQNFPPQINASIPNKTLSWVELKELKSKGVAMVSILFLAADPTNASRLRLGEEFREIQEKLKLAKLRDQFKLELPQLSLRPEDISQALLDTQSQIVHFSGHGTSTGALCFENPLGEIQHVQPDALAALFEQFVNQVNCVLLNACYSETQAKAIAAHIPYVIGMNQAIGDKAAIAFAIGFYQALGAGRTIDGSYKLGCLQIRLQDIPEHLTPVLIKRGQVQS